MNEVLQYINDILSQSFFLGMALAFLAGVVTVFTPCTLTNVPLIVSYMDGSGAVTKKKAFVYSVFICIGQAIIFITLALVVASLGKILSNAGFNKYWHLFLALITFWMALEILGITNILHRKKHCGVKKITKRGIFGAIGVGMIGAVFSSPCSTPVLAALLAYVAAADMSIILGCILALCYSLGHSIPLVIAGTSIGFAKALNKSKRFAKVSKVVKIVFGVLLIILSAYLVINTFFV